MFDFGKVTRVLVGDKTWIVGRLDMTALEAWRDWIKEQVGNPFDDLAKLKDMANFLPREELSAMLKEAGSIRDQLQGFTLACPLAQRFLKTEIGIAHLYLELMRPHHEDANINDAFAVVIQSANDAPLAKATGTVPEGKAVAPAA